MASLSILKTVKRLLGIQEDFSGFDTEIITHINTAFFTLNQLGIGPIEGFSIEDEAQEWVDFLSDRKDLEAIKTYIGQSVRLIFDPPQMGYLVTAIKEQLKELEWRLQIQGETEKPVITNNRRRRINV